MKGENQQNKCSTNINFEQAMEDVLMNFIATHCPISWTSYCERNTNTK